ncbi:hypothetical protein TNIN_333821 [Trichonephila inaurata madagascariensis]|uniref:Uncharacterized protein n=1 Tax=Trichonephila inaurata madagascariensis TaxID=2747483 RepID=A0A8X7CKP1_9ARAC|nr:hypothetical protein TNIN_333821 [Trichonephila inaurata madagascariensis]
MTSSRGTIDYEKLLYVVQEFLCCLKCRFITKLEVDTPSLWGNCRDPRTANFFASPKRFHTLPSYKYPGKETDKHVNNNPSFCRSFPLDNDHNEITNPPPPPSP